jgi:hypothetical protein
MPIPAMPITTKNLQPMRTKTRWLFSGKDSGNRKKNTEK